MVDLRSDTVTRPTAAMRDAMATADVGDDVFGEDPTVAALEARVARLLGKEAAVFVPSGVMANQIALGLHTHPGDEVIVGERSHIFHYESGAPGALWGVGLRPVGGPSGVLTANDVAAVVQGAYDWEARTRLVCAENTVNKAGGTVVSPEAMAPVADAARAHGLALHLDGARLWNAAAALGCAEAKLAAPFDTVSVCFSKGLGAPVGSALSGTAEAIRQARRLRKRLGGGMRQVGGLAAAASVALDDHLAGDRAMLRADHARAARLAEAIAARSDTFRLVAPPASNIVLFATVAPAPDVLARLEAAGVRMVAFGPHTVRAVLHRDVDDDALGHAIAAVDAA